MSVKSRWPLALLLAVLALLPGCDQKKTNHAPVIWSIDGPRSMAAGDSGWFTCNGTDPDGDLLSFSWSSSKGHVAWDWGKSTWLFVPDSADTAVLYVTVSDDSGLSARDSVEVAVLVDTIGLLFWDGQVKSGQYREWPDTVRATYTLYGRCGADTGQFYFMVMDDSNFASWEARLPATPLIRFLPYARDTFSVAVPATGRYHLIFDNRSGAEDYDYWINVWAHSR
jgi:hypothetical protein